MTDAIEQEPMWINTQGHHVPLSLVKPEDQMKHETAVSLVEKAKALQVHMIKLKELAFADVFAARL